MLRHHSSRSFRRAALAVAVFGLLGVACSSSGGSDAAKEDATTTTEVEDATTTTADEPTTTTEADPAGTTTTTGPGGERPSETTEGKAYVDALVDSFGLAESDPFTPEQVECSMAAWVDELGIDRFVANDITPENITAEDSDPADLQLTEAEAGTLIDLMGDCEMDLRAAIVQGLIEDSDDELTDEQQACVDAKVTEDDARRLYTMVLRGRFDQATTDPAMSAAEDCVG